MLFQSATVYAALLVYFINALHIATLNSLLARIDRNNMSAYKLLLPYHLKRLKKKNSEKGAGTSFILLSVWKQTIGQFIQSYLHRPMKILEFFTRGKIQKCFV